MSVINGAIDGFNAIISILRQAWVWIQQIFSSLSHAFEYMNHIVSLEWEIIGTLPNWLGGFVILSLGISVVLLITGRMGGIK